MLKVLRSVMWDDPKELGDATANLRVCAPDNLLDLKKTEREVIDYCLDFLVQKGEAPSLRLIHDVYEAANQVAAVSLIEEVLLEQPHSHASFKAYFDQVVEQQAAANLSNTLKEAAKIAHQGITDKGTTIKGTDAAIAYIFSSVREVPKHNQNKIPSSLKSAQVKLQLLYENRKANPHHSYGIMTGYGMIDSSTGGIRKGHLYIHAGFGGHLKSTMMLNMVLNAAVDGGWNPLVFSSEMPQAEMMYLLTTMHSANPKFATIGKPLNAKRLIAGALSPQEESFYKTVADDLVNNKLHGLIRVVDTSEFTSFGSVMQRTVREDAEEEVDEMWCDYITRLPIDVKYRNMSVTEGRNETLADAKRFAMSFRKGDGLAVCSPFQINREGYKKAKEHEGRMDKTALAQYNAVEKEADEISYTFFDEQEQAASEPKLGMMKSRWGEMNHKPISLYLDPDSRRIVDLSGGMAVTNVTSSSNVEAEVEI